MPAVFELIILPISNFIVVPAATITGLLTVYIKVELEEADNKPWPIPLLTNRTVELETSKPDGKVIRIVFINPVVAVLKKMSYVVLVFTISFVGITVTLDNVAAATGFMTGKIDEGYNIVNADTIRNNANKFFKCLLDLFILHGSNTPRLILFIGILSQSRFNIITIVKKRKSKNIEMNFILKIYRHHQ